MNKEINQISQVVHHDYNIPQDIVDEILSRLPVKSLLRFKAVSKLWYTIISNPSFRMRCPSTSIFVTKYNYHFQPQFHVIDGKGSIENFEVQCNAGDRDYWLGEISNSCNGMLLLQIDRGIFLLNPSTYYIDEVLTLSKCFYDYDTYRQGLGLCYDESIDGYKAIKLYVDENRYDVHVFVASLRENEWTKLPIPTDFYCMKLGPLMNGRLHATVRVGGYDRCNYGCSNHNGIVCFNPIKDVFEKVACPQPKSGEEYEIVGLGVLEDCLCMSRKVRDPSRGVIELLKMKEYGVAESWTTLFVVSEYSNYVMGSIDKFLGIGDGDILILTRQGYMWRYNLASKSFIKFIQEYNIGCYREAVTFEESLVSPRDLL